MGDGTYTGGLLAKRSPVGLWVAEQLVIQGNTVTPSNVIISTTSAHAISVGDSTGQFSQAMLKIKGLKLQTTTAGDCILNLGGVVQCDGLVFGACAGAHMNTLHHGWTFAITNYTISGNATNGHIGGATSGTHVGHNATVTFTADVTFYSFVNLTAHAEAYVNNMTFTLGGHTVTGPRYSVTEQAMIYTNYQGETYLPGDAAGIRNTGGRYDGKSYNTTSLTLQNSWVAFGGGFQSPQATLTAEGLVVIEGLIKSGTTTANTTLTTLPSGYRPAAPQLFIVATSSGTCRIQVGSDGTVVCHNAADATYTSLSGITFRVA